MDGVLREPGLSLGRADQWLEELRGQPRDGLALLLDTLGLDDVVMGLIADDRRFHDYLLSEGGKILTFLEKGIGLTDAWRRHRIGEAKLSQAAAAGRAMVATQKALERCGSLEEALERYAEKLAPVDRLRRSFEQRAHALWASDLEDYEALLEARVSVRRAYRTWANAINRHCFDL